MDNVAVCLPSTISTVGKLFRRSGGANVYNVTEFEIDETQNDFFSIK